MNLRVREVGVGPQIIEDLWCQLALVLPHPFLERHRLKGDRQFCYSTKFDEDISRAKYVGVTGVYLGPVFLTVITIITRFAGPGRSHLSPLTN